MDVTRSIRLTLAVAIAIVPLAGALFLDWDVREVLLLYWAENLVIGGWQFIKLASYTPHRNPRRAHAGKLFMLPFFLVHYGGFCAVHGLFLHSLTGHDIDGVLGGGSAGSFGPLIFLVLLWKVIGASIEVLPPASFLAIGAMIVSHGLDAWKNFFANGDWRASSRGHGLMFEPYKHIMVIHIAILAGGFLAIAMKENGIAVLALIIVGKLIIDWRAIRKEGQPPKEADDEEVEEEEP